MITLDPQLASFFRERKCAMPDIGLLQPADPILNAAGEDIRRRIFMTDDQGGRAFCLRPEFTIPVALHHIDSGKTRARYGYAGNVFRQRSDGHNEFPQIGIEDIGAARAMAADAKSLCDCVDLLRLLGAKKLVVSIGDQAIFEAVLASLGLPQAWQLRLRRAFGDPPRLRDDLDRLAGIKGDELASLDPKLRSALDASDKEGVTKLIAKAMKSGGLSPQAGRTAEEISARLMQKAELASVHLGKDQRHALETFLSLDVSLEKAGTRLWGLARKHDITIGSALENFHKRADAINKLRLENIAIRYRASFGRRLDYYTGFVFEIRKSGSVNGPLAGGGRYDRLLKVLGTKHDIPAIGFAIWTDRLGTRQSKSAGAGA